MISFIKWKCFWRGRALNKWWCEEELVHVAIPIPTIPIIILWGVCCLKGVILLPLSSSLLKRSRLLDRAHTAMAHIAMVWTDSFSFYLGRQEKKNHNKNFRNNYFRAPHSNTVVFSFFRHAPHPNHMYTCNCLIVAVEEGEGDEGEEGEEEEEKEAEQLHCCLVPLQYNLCPIETAINLITFYFLCYSPKYRYMYMHHNTVHYFQISIKNKMPSVPLACPLTLTLHFTWPVHQPNPVYTPPPPFRLQAHITSTLQSMKKTPLQW